MKKTVNILTFINILYFLENQPIISLIFIIFLLVLNKGGFKNVY